MIISPRHRLVILLPWKAASQTLRARLRGINRSPYSEFFHFNPDLNRVVHQHATLADFLGMPESQRGYRVAVFVRNPYDRVYSGFKQLARDVAAQPTMRFSNPWIRELVQQQLAENLTLMREAAFDLDAWFSRLPAYELLEAGRNTSLPLHPANYWTHTKGFQAADFIGRVETFESDFCALLERYGIEAAGMQNENQSDVGDSAPDANGYRHVNRLGAETVERINEIFAADFSLLGYEKVRRRGWISVVADRFGAARLGGGV